jgi:poly(3-hydroxybutyrate) depolymerase
LRIFFLDSIPAVHKNWITFWIENHLMKLGPYDIGLTAVYAAKRDPRFSYCLYVPPGYRESDGAPELVVVVHGSPRTFMDFRDRFQAFGDTHNALILCPLFPVGVSGDDNADGYKYLAEPGIQYDEILLGMVEDVSARWGVRFARFGLFGFSGGAQFVNRFLLRQPAHLWATSIAAPGSVTLVSDRWDWWVGTRGVAVDREALRRVPVQTVVGAADTETHEITHREGGHYWMPDANVAGATRPDRLEALRKSLVEAGVAVTHELVPGVGHDPWPIIERAKKFLAAELSRLRRS